MILPWHLPLEILYGNVNIKKKCTNVSTLQLKVAAISEAEQ
jgi:hypothetical protein